MGQNLNLYIGNRLETLADQLCRVIERPLSSVLTPETIVVQSRGMEHWLSMQMARHQRICANCYFPFPNTFVADLYNICFGGQPDSYWDTPDSLAFQIMKILPDCIGLTGFEYLHTYLEDDPKGLKRYQLSEKIADVFDQYLVFRPEMILAWEDGKESHWQAQLWRKLTQENGWHKARLRQQLLERLQHPDEMDQHLPERIAVFGISYLPLYHMQLFDAMSAHIRVNIFLMNPCREYWADIVSHKEMKRIRDRYKSGKGLEAELHLDKGNRLLASMGRQGRDFLARMVEFDSQLHEFFEDPEGGALLNTLQSDLLNLSETDNLDTADCTKTADRSVQFHACHGFMREIEVLQDQLLAMFEDDPELQPIDIIVMTPDMETYAPYIQAVFGAPESESVKIPYRIADRRPHGSDGLIKAFLNLLEFHQNRRADADRILDLLEYKAIRNKLNFTPNDVRMIERWVGDTRIHWGIDAEGRNDLGMPALKENTWRDGFERLLQGYAMGEAENKLAAGILPYGPIEGGESLVLGRFIEFMRRLFDLIDVLSKQNKLDRWIEILEQILEEYFELDQSSEKERLAIRQVVDSLAACHGLTGFNEPVMFNLIHTYLTSRLNRECMQSGFISGGVTFCAMLPMRSIPFKVVCLIGMSADMFPRDTQSVGFDRMARNPKPGDRSRREDDKYLFLEALLSSRKRFYVSYVGQDIQDNSTRPPSAMVSELIEYMGTCFQISPDKLVVKHGLQAFSPVYFKGNRNLFTYSQENRKAGTQLYHARQRLEYTPGFIGNPLHMNAEELADAHDITIDQLVAFLIHPARYLLRNRLGIYLDEKISRISARENFALEALDRYHIEQDLVEITRQGGNLDNLYPVFRKSGYLPLGTVGSVHYGQAGIEAEEFVRKCQAVINDQNAASIEIDLRVSDFHIGGQLNSIFPSGPVQFAYLKFGARHILNAWICHLFYHIVNPDNRAASSLLICKDQSWKFDSVSAIEAQKYLTALLELYLKGLLLPIRFIPEISYAFAYSVSSHDAPISAALARAEKKWTGGFFRGANQDPYYDLCFSHLEISELFDQAFQEIAMAVFEPILKSMSKITSGP